MRTNKNGIVATLLSLCFWMSTAIQGIAQPTSGLNYNAAMRAEWQRRTIAGPYRAYQDVGENTPGDWIRIQQQANTFKANPLKTTSTDVSDSQIWGGHPVGNISDATNPAFHGIGANAAGFVYVVTGDTSYGNAVKKSLLAQIAIPAADVSLFPLDPAAYKSNNRREQGFKESYWLTRILYAFDYTRDLYSPSEKSSMMAFFSRSAYYLSATFDDGLISFCFPNRLDGNYLNRLNYAGDLGKVSESPYQIYEKPSGPDDWGDNFFVVTHRNADGTLGNNIPILGPIWSNRASNKFEFIGLYGLMAGDQNLQMRAKRYFQEFIKYSLFANGLVAEYNRAGDYENPSQGLWYHWINVCDFVTLADAYARAGDFSFYTYQTSEGLHGTEGGPKSLKTMLEFVSRYVSQQNEHYHSTVSPANKIGMINPLGVQAHWDYVLALANAYYKDDYFYSIYTRKCATCFPYGKRSSTAARVPICWQGTSAEHAGFLFQFGKMESFTNFTVPGSPTIRITGNTSTINKAQTFVLVGQVSEYVTRWDWQKLEGPALNFKTRNQRLTINADAGSMTTTGQYRFLLRARTRTGATVSTIATITVVD